ncbi:MAG: YncE family protein [Elusimicrobiota bacterium]
MAEQIPEDASLPEWRGEIERLWAKVSQSPSDSAAAVGVLNSLSLTESPAAVWEAMSLLRAKHRREAQAWAEILESKEKAIASLRDRERLSESERESLRRRIQSHEEKSIEGAMGLQAELEAASSGLREQRVRHEEDEKRLRALLDQARERIARESDIWKKERKSWEKKEEKYLAQMRELESLAQIKQDESRQALGESNKLSQSLKEAKNALEKTLAELLRERQIRDETEKERAQALKKVDEVQRHFDELSKIWEDERAQWRELWDRERSTWETQRAEFSSWEDKLRRERERWHAELTEKEKDHLRFAAQMAETLRQSTETSFKIQGVLKSVANFGLPPERRKTSRRIWAALGAVAICFGAAVPVWRYYSIYHFIPEAVVPVSFLKNPTGLAYDGAKIWVSQWDGHLEAFDPIHLDAAPLSVLPDIKLPYHPVSIIFAKDSFWTANAASARLIRQEAADPAREISSLAAAGPAPTAMAYDGRAIWCYDAADRSLDRYRGDGQIKSFGLGDAVPTSLLWVSRRLWAFDAKTRKLEVFDFKDNVFSMAASYDLGESVIGMTAVKTGKGRELWVLAGPSGARTSPAFIKFRY